MLRVCLLFQQISSAPPHTHRQQLANTPCPPPPSSSSCPSPNPAISKVNTPLNAGLTHFHCGWFCFQFSHHLSHPTTSEEKRKLLFRKQKKKSWGVEWVGGGVLPANQTCKCGLLFFPCQVDLFKRGKSVGVWMPKRRRGGRKSEAFHFSCSSEAVIAVFLPFPSPWESVGAPSECLHRNHGAHNNRRKPVT